MAQGRKNLTDNKAVEALNDSNPHTLRDDMKLVRRDGGVYLQTLIPGGDYDERRVDSPMDADTRAKGGRVWYDELFKQQELRDNPKPAPKTKAAAKKESSDE